MRVCRCRSAAALRARAAAARAVALPAEPASARSSASLPAPQHPALPCLALPAHARRAPCCGQVGIIGAGRIGAAYARMMVEGHKMDLVYYDPYPNTRLEDYIRK